MSIARNSDTSQTFNYILSRLHGVKKNGRGFIARCPAHEDRDPSLSLEMADDGKILLKCFAGCEIEDICNALGVTLADLFPENGDRRGWSEPIGKSKKPAPPPTYTYHDAKGHVLFGVVRMPGKRFGQCRPDGDGWVWGLGDIKPVLYHLPGVIQAVKGGKVVHIVEGEKDADNLAALGLAATCNPMGAGKWRSDYTESLGGASVAILADNDDVGRKHAQQVARSLHGKAAAVKVIEFPELPEKSDVSDWLAQGHTIGDLLERVADAPMWEPGPDLEGEPEPWEPPVPLGEHSLPEFPTASLPGWLKSFVEAEAEATQTPPDLAGMLALSVCAASVAKKAVVQVRPGWVESLNLWTVTALLPGNRKSAVFRDLEGPLVEWERSAARDKGPEIAEAQNSKKILEQTLGRLQNDTAKAKKPEEREKLTYEAGEVAKELAAFTLPVQPRLIVDDCSPERLASLLYEQAGRMAVMSPEGDVFELMSGRYGNGAPNLGVYLKGHAGDALRVDRVGRPPEYVEAPALTLGLTVQPDVLRGLVDKPGFRGRGLLARFLYALPVSTVGRRSSNAEPVPEAVRATYGGGVLALLDIPPGTDQRGEPAPHTLRLSPEAADLFLGFLNELEPQLDVFGALGDVADWASKLAGAVVRIAGVLHLARYAGYQAPWTLPIEDTTMAGALQLGKYAIPHAKAAFQVMGADLELEGARHVLEWIERKAVGSFTKRDAHRELQGRFKRVKDLEPALMVLIEHGYIREKDTDDKAGRGRKPSPVFEVNPLMTDLTQMTETVIEPNCVNTVNSVTKELRV